MPGFQFQSSVTYDTPRTSDFTLQDNVNLKFGTGGDATIDYDGTHLVIDPQVVGSGNLLINAGSIDLNNQGSLINVGAAGNDWTAATLQHQGSTTGVRSITVHNTSNADALDRARLHIKVGGTSAGDPYIDFLVDGGQRLSIGLDNSVSDNFTVSDNDTLGTNDRLRLVTATGVLSVDGDGGGADDPVSLFDEYDDARELQRYAYTLPMAPVTEEQRIANRNHMVEMGVAEWAVQDEGPDHLMIRMQPMTKLLAGGVYQNRQKIDDLEARLKALEGQLTCQM